MKVQFGVTFFVLLRDWLKGRDGMGKRIFALFMALCMGLTIMTNGGSVTLYASEVLPGHNEIIKPEENTEDGIMPEFVTYSMREDSDVSEYGYEGYKLVDSNGDEISMKGDFVGPVWMASESVPSNYKSPYVTSVKNQGPNGTCWAHATIACAEASMNKNGLVKDFMKDTTAQEVNLSEKHLVWFSGGASPADSTDPFYNEMSSAGAAVYSNGGNHMMSYNALSKWWGVELESNHPYTNLDGSGIDESARYSSFGHLKNMMELDIRDLVSVKKEIMDKGAVMVSYYSESDYYKHATYNDEDTYSFYYYDYDSDLNTNHAVTIIGWDDNYPKENFVSEPANNGAWLCKNSWDSDWGVEGYFYISYEEMSLDRAVSFEMESADAYDNNYQYDGVYYGGMAAEFEMYGVNVFTAKGNESLKAVGFVSNASNFEYTVKIFKNFTALDEASGSYSTADFIDDADATITGTGAYAGYYTVELDEALSLQEGEKYAVAISCKHYDSANDMYLYHFTRDKKCTVAGQSFYTFVGYYSTDLVNSYNVCVKAFTDDAGEYDISDDNITVKETGIFYKGENAAYTDVASVSVVGQSDVNGITVDNGVTAELLLDNVKASTLTVNGDVVLYVNNECDIDSIVVSENGSLTVKGNGKLSVGTLQGNACVNDIFMEIGVGGTVSGSNCMIKQGSVFNVYGTYKLDRDLDITAGESAYLVDGAKLEMGEYTITNNGSVTTSIGSDILKGGSKAIVGTDIVNNGVIDRYCETTNSYVYGYDGNELYGATGTVIEEDEVVIQVGSGEYLHYGYDKSRRVSLTGDATVGATVEHGVVVNASDISLYMCDVKVDTVVAGESVIMVIAGADIETLQVAKNKTLTFAGTGRANVTCIRGDGAVIMQGSDSITITVEKLKSRTDIVNGTVDIDTLECDICVTGGSVRIADAGAYKVLAADGAETGYIKLKADSYVYTSDGGSMTGYNVPAAHATDTEYIHLWHPVNKGLYVVNGEDSTLYIYGPNSNGVNKWLIVVDSNYFSWDGKEDEPVVYTYNGQHQAPTISKNTDHEDLQYTVRYKNLDKNTDGTQSVDAGNYSIYVDVALSENYALVTDVTDYKWCYSIKPLVMEQVSISGINSPKAGEILDVNCDEDDKVVVQSLQWFKNGETVTGIADYESVYTVKITLQMKSENYVFGDNFAAMVNETAAQVENYGGYVCVMYIFDETEKAFIYGDANSDGVISVADGVAMKRYLAGTGEVIDMEASDLDGTAGISVSDAVALLRYLAGDSSVVLGKG